MSYRTKSKPLRICPERLSCFCRSWCSGDLPLREVRAQPLNAIADSELSSLEWSRCASCFFAKERRADGERKNIVSRFLSKGNQRFQSKLLSVYRYSRANSLPPSAFLLHPFAVPRFKCPVPIDDYV